MKLHIEVFGFDHHSVETQDAIEGDIIDNVAHVSEQTREELEGLIKSRKWCGGEWRQELDSVVLITDVDRIVHTLIED